MAGSAGQQRSALAARLRRRFDDGLDVVPGLRAAVSELARIELIDRSLALGAQALLALIPLLILLGSLLPRAVGTELVDQLSDIMGVDQASLTPLRRAAAESVGAQPEAGWFSLLVSLASATSFSRAMQRMYARVWELPTFRGVRALRGSLLWLIGWVAVLQATALLLGSVDGLPLDGAARVVVQFCSSTLLWWWSAWLLLGGRVPWRHLLPGAVLTGFLLVVLAGLSRLFMPRFTRAHLEQYGALGVVFAVASWLVVFGGAIVVGAVLGRQVSAARRK